MDTSEARYAEMARKMVELNDWITPMFDYGVPFWGKPPLSFWTQAASMKLFGINEFAARFPAWLLHLASCFIIIKLATQEMSRRAGIWGAIIFSSTTLGLVSSGVVLTDPVLSFSILLASYGFWRWMKCAGKADAYLMFLGLGLGLLAKGPLTLVLMGMPAFAWIVIHKEWNRMMMLPVGNRDYSHARYFCALVCRGRIKAPGFMEYFFVGEHWSRYVISDWAGDLYGSAHAKPYGTIWIQLGLSLLPWAFFLPLMIRRRASMQRSRLICGSGHWPRLSSSRSLATFSGPICSRLYPPGRCFLQGESVKSAFRPAGLLQRALSCCQLWAQVSFLRWSTRGTPQNQRDVVDAWFKAQSAQIGCPDLPAWPSFVFSEFYK